ncbi:hypothetical protein HNP47_003029 [Brevundimonas vesicularis]|uniref:Uncharacterized protein n=1 Tax=Brevundimonas vesicularis TaxID=41276 RepID=A0A7W9L734_BREVE|nr:hypothetical protein [Brevundimonas sp. BT-123]MBB5773009.1 hypothetical protein [Brevundimonas vesicularis]MCW0046385.1 hypothetical protein [Brevundimonas sp. BT-123]
MEVVVSKTSSRRRPRGGGGFDAKKQRSKRHVSKFQDLGRFRLIAKGGRDKRATMPLANELFGCNGRAEAVSLASLYRWA